MMSRIRANFIVFIILLVFSVSVWIYGCEDPFGVIRIYSAAVTTLLLAFIVWERWFWRFHLIQRFSSVPRDIRGTWKGELETFWKRPDGTSPPRKTVYLVVRQSASKLTVVLLTDESRSASSLAVLSSDGTTVSLDYMYFNLPQLRVEERSRMHHGSASLIVSGTPANRLRGRYWTSRDTRGELDFTARMLPCAEDFERAASLFFHDQIEKARS